jgi:hypothetical protein
VPRRYFRSLRALLVSFLLTWAMPAGAAQRLHALVIGNNGVFPAGAEGEDQGAAAVPLKYADDDAAGVSALLGEAAASLHLLTVMDATTQALYPELVATARPPTLASVEQAVLAIAAELERDRARGDQSTVWLFFSGHGSTSYRGEPGLALSDGALSRRFLYDHVLARLPAAFVHLLVDACHAESIVRPRDAHAEAVAIAPEVTTALLARSTLTRFPHVGAILVSSRDAQAHEWDAIGHGVFTHQLLSALRGAADVNADRLIEYSEVQAFMSAANRSVADTRARVALVARAPELNRRAPLFDLSQLPRERSNWLTGVSGERGIVQVLDEFGRRIVTLHNAPDLSTSLLLPAGVALHVVAGKQEANLTMRPGQSIRFGDLNFLQARFRSRGSLSAALERGLFATRFGRSYYEGFTDNTADLVAVPFAPAPDEAVAPATLEAERRPEPGVRLAAGVGLSSATASVLGTSAGLRVVVSPAGGHGPSVAIDGSTASDGPLTEWRATGTLGWVWQTRPSQLRVYAGPRVGAGIIVQNVEGESPASGVVGVGAATAGVITRVTRQLGLFAELELAAQLLQRDGLLTVDAVPSAFMGATWELR